MKRYPVLTYHKVTPQWELSFTMIYPEQFRKQMQFLAGKGYTGTSLRDYLNNPADKCFVLTFDDAYENIYENAVPVLDELGFRATVFVPTAYIGKDNSWDFTPGNIRSRHMNEDQIRELRQKGWEIASHGEHHRVITAMPVSEQQRELETSKKLLEAVTGESVETFCFPFGVYNEAAVKAAKKAGYKILAGFTGASRHGVISRSVVYRVVDTPHSVLRKIRVSERCHFYEYCKEQLFHSFSIFSRLKQKLSH